MKEVGVHQRSLKTRLVVIKVLPLISYPLSPFSGPSFMRIERLKEYNNPIVLIQSDPKNHLEFLYDGTTFSWLFSSLKFLSSVGYYSSQFSVKYLFTGSFRDLTREMRSQERNKRADPRLKQGPDFANGGLRFPLLE